MFYFNACLLESRVRYLRWVMCALELGHLIRMPVLIERKAMWSEVHHGDICTASCGCIFRFHYVPGHVQYSPRHTMSGTDLVTYGTTYIYG